MATEMAKVIDNKLIAINNARKTGNYVCTSAFGLYVEDDSLELLEWSVFDLLVNLEAYCPITGAFYLAVIAELGDVISPPSNK